MRKSGWISGLAVQLVLTFFIPLLTIGQTWGPKYTSMTWGTGGYYEYLPVGYNDPGNAGKKYPVILFIHGIGEQGNGTSDLGRVRTVGFPTVINAGFFPNSFNVNGQDFSFIAIVPQFSGWPGSDQISNILDYIQANYRADESRLYLTGLSMGGGVTWDYASSSSAAANRLAAILPVCGASSPNTTKTQIMANAKLPVLATHNDLDPTVPVGYTHGYVDGMNSFGVNPSAIKVIWSSAIHNAWSRTYDPYEKLTGNLNAYEWLLQHSRGSATPPPPAALSASISSSTSVSCNGSGDGSATVRASGGTAPYSYSWSTSPVQTGVTATGLAAGSYTVTVRDANNATSTASVTINQPARLTLTVTPGTIALYGGTTSVSLSASGGTAPYTYSGPVTNVTAGTYTYTVTDAKGCTDTKSVTVTQPAPTPLVVLMENWRDVTCYGGSDGSATIRVSGGIAPFTYRWNTAPVQNGVTASNLAAGAYTVTVTDASGATSTLNVSVAQPEKLNVLVTPGTISVNGGTTTVSLNASGGNPPYTFSGPTSNVRAGTYTYTVTDAKGCTDTKTVTITEPPATAAFVLSTVKTNVTCSGLSNGSASVSVTGGVAPYSYSWNSTPAQTSANATALPAGTYTVTVRDANNDVVTASVSIGEPAPLSIVANAGTISTNGGTTNVAVSATGGTAPYTFTGGTTNLRAGTYTFGVTDANGCTDTRTITITEPAPALPVKLVLNTWTYVSCHGGADGSATVAVIDGQAPFTVSWNTTPAQNSFTAVNLRAGSYIATVRDANNTVSSVTVNIAEPDALVLNALPGTISVNGGSTSVTLQATGGTAPYTFAGPVSDVRAGTYTYTVTDAKGCTASRTVSISEPPPPPPAVTITGRNNSRCAGSADGSATAVVTGGKAPYTYKWNTSPVQNTATANSLSSGIYTVTVTDANNLSSTATVIIDEPAALTLQVQAGTIANFNGTTSVTLNATGGVAPYSFSGPTANVVAGTYTYQVTDANGCTDSKMITITQPPAPPAAVLILAPSAKAVSCFGGADGTATVVPETGTAPYTYSWSTTPAQTTPTATGLRAGTYTVTVRDANNASGTTTITVGEPAKLSLQAKAGTIDIHGGLTDVTLIPGGGTAPYAFSGITTSLKAGSYTFSVTDANGCAESTTISISEPPPPATPTAPAATPLSARATTTAVTCFGGRNGSARLDITGGKTPYEVSWTGPATLSGAEVNGIAAGIYQVTVKDADQQTISIQVEVVQPSALSLNITANDIQTVGGTTQVLLQATGGVAPYAFSGVTAGLKAGTYQYQVTDANGCTANKEVVIREVLPLTLQVTAGKITCYDGTTSVSLMYSGGVAPYKVTGDTTGVKAGNHTYIITDAAGNRTSQSIVIQQPEKLELIASPGLVRKIGGTTNIELSAKGGTMPYNYVGEVSNVRAGKYTYNVVDANGCNASAEAEVREPAVTLSSFDALKSDTTVDLKWSTSYEYAIDHFDIERSEDNLSYALVSRVTSLWNSLRTARYVATDGRPYLKRNYYRVVAVTSFGERIVLDQKDLFYDKKGAFTVKNMPTMLDITIENAYMEPLTLVLYDMNGKPLRMKTFEKQTYNWNTKMDLQGLPAGSYIIHAQSTKYKYAKQVVKL